MNSVRNSVMKLVEDNSPDSCFPHENWNSLQFLSSLDDDSDLLKILLTAGANVNRSSSGCCNPSVSSLHIAVSRGKLDAVEQLIKFKCDLNVQDQWGFTALHYAVLKRSTKLILLLTTNGAIGSLESKIGSTPLDLAHALKYTEIEDILSSQLSSETNPSNPKFKEWLCHLGAGEYVSNFLNAGYDLPFIARAGLVEADLDCVGIPMSKLGIRKKILLLHNIEDYYDDSPDTGDEEGDSESESEEESSEEESDDD